MFCVNILSQEVFFEKDNKFIVLDYEKYLEFLKNILYLNNNVTINGLKLNDKNSLVIDFTSITSLCNLISEESKISTEYLKTKIDNYDILESEKRIVDNINELLQQIKLNNIACELDIRKILKQSLKLDIRDKNELIDMIEYIIKKSNIKQFIILYSNKILKAFKLTEKIEKLKENDNVLEIEICTDDTKISKNDNITIVSDMLYQVSGNDLFNIIKENDETISDEDIENYLLFSLFGKRVDNVDNKVIKKIFYICKERLNLTNLFVIDP